DFDARGKRARLLVELGIDERHAALERPPGKRVDDDGTRRAHSHCRRILFEDRDLYPQLAAVRYQKEIRARLHRLTLDDVLFHDLARTRGPQGERARDCASRLQTIDLIRWNVPKGQPATRARRQSVVLKSPGEEILLLRAHEIGR